MAISRRNFYSNPFLIFGAYLFLFPMDDKQRLREIEEVLTVILQEQDRLKAEMQWLHAERDRAEERISRLERAVEAQQQGSYPFTSCTADSNTQWLQAERLVFLLTQPQTQN